MFCNKCGLELPKNSKFCPRCGLDNKNPVIEAERITKEEYLARTNIKSPEEAKKYYTRLKILFIGSFVFSLLDRVLSDSTNVTESNALLFLLILVLDIGILIYFIIYSIKVLKAEKLSGWNAALCIFFAPLSWFWFYPDIMDPLKIIMGKKKPPFKNSTIKEKNKNFFQKWWIPITLISFILLLVISYIVAVIISK